MVEFFIILSLILVGFVAQSLELESELSGKAETLRIQGHPGRQA